MSIIHEVFEKQKWFLINELNDLLSSREMTMRKREIMSRTIMDLKCLFEAHTLGHELGVEEEEDDESEKMKYEIKERTIKPAVVHNK